MAKVLPNVYGNHFIVRPPVPATVNKAGANYKSEVKHAEYSPRRAFDEWVAICEGITKFGGDAIFDFEEDDDAFLDHDALHVDADGAIRAEGESAPLGHLDEVQTGRVFCANGPWVTVDKGALSAVLPNMLEHRKDELAYYEALLDAIATFGEYEIDVGVNPHRWEGMADVAVVGEQVVLTHTVKGRYDAGLEDKTMRSSQEGVAYAADFVGVPEEACIFAELKYPHFHGDTVHFGARPKSGGAKLAHYAGGLVEGEAERVAEALPKGAIVPIGRDDAVEFYAGNSRQVGGGVLVPDGVTDAFVASMEALGLPVHRVALFELFGKAGGGPACATLYLPKNLTLPKDTPLLFSNRAEEIAERRARIPERLTVDPAYFANKKRG